MKNFLYIFYDIDILTLNLSATSKFHENFWNNYLLETFLNITLNLYHLKVKVILSSNIAWNLLFWYSYLSRIKIDNLMENDLTRLLCSYDERTKQWNRSFVTSVRTKLKVETTINTSDKFFSDFLNKSKNTNVRETIIKLIVKTFIIWCLLCNFINCPATYYYYYVRSLYKTRLVIGTICAVEFYQRRHQYIIIQLNYFISEIKPFEKVVSQKMEGFVVDAVCVISRLGGLITYQREHAIDEFQRMMRGICIGK